MSATAPKRNRKQRRAEAVGAVVFDDAAAEAFLKKLRRLDTKLVEHGFHETSPWWRTQLERLVRALPRGVRRVVIRAGRRAGKSSTICRLLVSWGLWGSWHVPAGDTAVVPFFSVSREEASARLRTIAAILDVLEVPYEVRGDEIEVRGKRPMVFRVYAATKRAVGYTAISLAADEVSRWENRDDAANPAAEVFASAFPAMASQPFAFALLVSSPWGTDDYHAQRFDEGDNDDQIVAYAPTWVANPSITEEQTHKLDPNPNTWSREYAAIPGATESQALDAVDLVACYRALPSDLHSRFVTTDASSLRGDAWAWIEGGLSPANELVVTHVHGWSGDELRKLSMGEVVQTVARRAREIGAAKVFGDQREEASLRSMFAEHDVHFQSFAWSEPSKDSAMQTLRRLLRDRRVVLPEHALLRSQLTSMKARLLPSGRISYPTNGLDFASALITLMHAVDARDYVLEIDDGPMVISIGSERAGRPGIWSGNTRLDTIEDWEEARAERRRRFLKDDLPRRNDRR